MTNALEIKNLNKLYDNKNYALSNISFNVQQGEIFALLGPNGAGKSTLINIICGITNKTSGKVKVFGMDNIKNYKKARALIGLVPQEIATDSFERVINTMKFSRGLFNMPASNKYLEDVLEKLALQEKNNQIRTLSGGMKRRVMIAKALSHEPKILFLDEPTAGVDVELRKSLWKNISSLKDSGVTIFLTTHYIEEAEKMADRIGIIHNGSIKLIKKKNELMKTLGKKTIIINLSKDYDGLDEIIKKYKVQKNKLKLTFTYDFKTKENSPSEFLKDLAKKSIKFNEIETQKSSLEDIFLGQIQK